MKRIHEDTPIFNVVLPQNLTLECVQFLFCCPKMEAESHQYEQDESEVWKHHQLQRHFEDKGHWWTFAKKREVRRWTLTLITGLFCGALAVFITFGTKLITKFKFDVFYGLLEKEKGGEVYYGASFVFLFASNLMLGYAAFLTVYVEPLAAGSGNAALRIFVEFV